MPTNVDSDNGALEPAIALEELVAVAENGSDDDLKALLLSLHPADVAELINLLDRVEIRTESFAFSRRTSRPSLEPGLAAAREKIVQDLSVDHLRQILLELDSDDAADLLGWFRGNERKPSWPACRVHCPHESSS